MPIVLLDARQLGARLGVGYGTVLSWARRGRIPSLKGRRGRVLFDFDRVLESLQDERPPSLSVVRRHSRRTPSVVAPLRKEATR